MFAHARTRERGRENIIPVGKHDPLYSVILKNYSIAKGRH